jgi:hypothetical protein
MSLYPVCYYNITLTNSPQILGKKNKNKTASDTGSPSGKNMEIEGKRGNRVFQHCYT